MANPVLAAAAEVTPKAGIDGVDAAEAGACEENSDGAEACVENNGEAAVAVTGVGGVVVEGAKDVAKPVPNPVVAGFVAGVVVAAGALLVLVPNNDDVALAGVPKEKLPEEDEEVGAELVFPNDNGVVVEVEKGEEEVALLEANKLENGVVVVGVDEAVPNIFEGGAAGEDEDVGAPNNGELEKLGVAAEEDENIGEDEEGVAPNGVVELNTGGAAAEDEFEVVLPNIELPPNREGELVVVPNPNEGAGEDEDEEVVVAPNAGVVDGFGKREKGDDVAVVGVVPNAGVVDGFGKGEKGDDVAAEKGEEEDVLVNENGEGDEDGVDEKLNPAMVVEEGLRVYSNASTSVCFSF